MNRLRNRLIHLSIPALVLATALVGTAGAAPSAPTGIYPAWTITPEDTAAQNHSGTIAFDTLGLSDATYTVEKDSEDGEDTELTTADDSGDWLTADTPFGAVFGASGPSSSIQFLKTRVDDETTATTTITFASPVPAGVLGFAIGDIDVDQLVIAGTTADGSAITGAQFDGTTFNYCDVDEPRPENCDGVEAPYAVPTWNPATLTLSYPPDEDTDGSGASFRPTVAVSSLTFTFSSVSSSSPSFRLWVAALSSELTGSVSFPADSQSVPVTVKLLGPDGSVLGTTTTDEDGNYSFPAVVATNGLQIELVVPAGFLLEGSSVFDVDLRGGPIDVPFALVTGERVVVPTFTG